MPVPTHGPTCETQAFYHMHCQFCNSNVYFFMCSCGSKVFFEHPHHPWPKHKCIKYVIWHYAEIEGTPVDQIRSIIEQEAIERNESISEDTLEYLDELEASHGGSPKINVVHPEDGERPAVLGQIHTYNPGVNFLKRFDFPDTRISRKIMGESLDKAHIEVKIREETNSPNIYNELKVFIPAKMYNESNATMQSKVFVILEQKSIPDHGTVWIAGKMELLA